MTVPQTVTTVRPPRGGDGKLQQVAVGAAVGAGFLDGDALVLGQKGRGHVVHLGAVGELQHPLESGDGEGGVVVGNLEADGLVAAGEKGSAEGNFDLADGLAQEVRGEVPHLAGEGEVGAAAVGEELLAEGEVDGVLVRLAEQRGGEIRRGDRGDGGLGLLGVRADMRRENHLPPDVRRQQGVVGSDGLAVEDVERGSGENSRTDGLGAGLLVDQAAARAVHEVGSPACRRGASRRRASPATPWSAARGA